MLIERLERLFTTKVDQNKREKIKRKRNHPNAEHTNAQHIQIKQWGRNNSKNISELFQRFISVLFKL